MKLLKKFTVVDLFEKIDQLNKEKDKAIELINEYSNNVMVVEYYICKKDKLQTKIEFLLELIDELNMASKELGD